MCDIHKKCRNIKYFLLACGFLTWWFIADYLFHRISPHWAHWKRCSAILQIQKIKQHRNHIRSLANYKINYIHILKSPNLSLFKLIYLVTDVFFYTIQNIILFVLSVSVFRCVRFQFEFSPPNWCLCTQKRFKPIMMIVFCPISVSYLVDYRPKFLSNNIGTRPWGFNFLASRF